MLRNRKLRRLAASIAIVGALGTSGCSTALSRACEAGQSLNGMTPGETCQAALVEGQQRNAAIMAGVGTALVGAVAAVAVVQAVRPDRTYVQYGSPFPSNVYVYPRY